MIDIKEIDRQIREKALCLWNAAISAVKECDPIAGWNLISARESPRHQDRQALLVQTLEGGKFRVFEYSGERLIPFCYSGISAKEILSDGHREYIRSRSPFGGDSDLTLTELHKIHERNKNHTLEIVLRPGAKHKSIREPAS